MKIAVDAMGGDWAPQEIIKGAIQAASALDVNIALVGNPEEISAAGKEVGLPVPGVEVVPARQKVEMGDQPAYALRHKKESSLAVAASLVRSGDAGALVSAGNTGAAMAFSLRNFGRLPGVDRPGIAIPFPTTEGFCIFIDGGANLEAKPRYLLQFAQMGSLYAQHVLGREDPKVALLNVGLEAEKGTSVLQEGYKLLAASQLNFTGNIEGRDLPFGVADVVVTDGFSGNLILKFAEGFGAALMDMLKSEVKEGGLGVRLGAYLAGPVFRGLKARMSYEEYGGALLLGLKHPTVICHGSSNAKAIFNAIRVAKGSLIQDVAGRISMLLQKELQESSEKQ
jgi:glycerol-3-phosphate acyltransferase PlsX